MPDWAAMVRDRIRSLSLEPVREAEIVEEVAQHVEDRYRELVATGSSRADAERAALAEITEPRVLADLLADLEPSRPVEPPVPGDRRGRWLAGLARDAWLGIRALRRSPGFTLIAVLSLALGSGANTAIFQLLDSVRLRRLPVPKPGELVDVKIANLQGLSGSFEGWHPEFTYPLWERIRDRQKGLSAIYAWSNESLDLAAGGERESGEAIWVSGGFFSGLGVRPQLGRLLTPADDHPGCGSSGIVISDGFWRRRYGSDESVLGRPLVVEGVPFPIIDVTEPGFFGLEIGWRFDLALPLCAQPMVRPDRNRLGQNDFWWLAIGGRLAPGWSAERVSAQLAVISPDAFAETLPLDYPAEIARAYRSYRLGVVPGGSGRSIPRQDYSPSLWLLLAIGGLVLLIAGANLANLLLSRATTREREMAARLALGASRARLVRQLLVESLILAAAGIGAGAVLAQWLSRLLVAMLSTPRDPLYLDLAPDARLFAFAGLVALVTCLAFGLAPAFRAAAVAPIVALRGAGRGLTRGIAGRRLERGLVVAQVGLSLVLLVTALLFVGRFRNLVQLDPGFRQDGIVVTTIDLSRLGLPDERRRQEIDQVVDRLRAIPGVVGAATSTMIPTTDHWSNDFVRVEAPGGPRGLLTNTAQVGAHYFAIMDVPLLAGRDFGPEDRSPAPPVAIVNEAFARRMFDGADPIGREYTIGHDASPGAPRVLIVGLVKNTKYRGMREPFEPITFLPATQGEARRYLNVFIRSDQPLDALAPSIRRAIAEVDPGISLELSTFKARVREGLARDRLMAALAGFFGLLALVLATTGLYGVVSYMVSRRTNEVGIRMALGADRVAIVRMVLVESLVLVGSGLVAGFAGALVATRFAGSLLFGLPARDAGPSGWRRRSSR